jgi:vacuolar-type H+-ATPase subunit H
MDVMRRRKSDEAETEVTGKLGRLLQTEASLEAMLDETRRAAAQRVEAARALARERVRDYEASLESERNAIRADVEREVEETIRSLRAEAKAKASRLEGVDASSVARLARRVLDLLVEGIDSQESR